MLLIIFSCLNTGKEKKVSFKDDSMLREKVYLCCLSRILKKETK